jgi:hypothetical protein
MPEPQQQSVSTSTSSNNSSGGGSWSGNLADYSMPSGYRAAGLAEQAAKAREGGFQLTLGHLAVAAVCAVAVWFVVRDGRGSSTAAADALRFIDDFGRR